MTRTSFYQNSRRGLAICLCILGILTVRQAWAWDWYAGSIADYRAQHTSAGIPERIQAAIDLGMDWVGLAGDEQVGQYVGLGELLQEYELNAPRMVPILSTGWADSSEASHRLLIFGVDPRAPVPSGGLANLLAWAGSHNGIVLFREFPSAAASTIGRSEVAFVGLKGRSWDPACRPGGAWDDRLKAGHRVYIVGSGQTETNGLVPDRTYVWAERGEPAAIIDGIRRGAVYVAQGDAVRLDLRVNGAGMGEAASVLGEAYVRIRATGRQPIRRVSLIADGEVVWTAQPDMTVWEERFFLPLQGRSYLRAVATCGEEGLQSLGNPVFLSSESDIGQGEVPLGEQDRAHPEPIYLEIDGALEVLANLELAGQARILRELLRSVELRYETARVLEVRKDLVPDPVLWDVLQDTDPEVRLGAACALVLRASVELPEVLVGLLQDPNHDVRAYAARMLYQYSDGLPAEDAFPLLLTPDPIVRAYLIRALPPSARADTLTAYLAEQAQSASRAVASAAADKLLAMGTRDYRVIQALLTAAHLGNDRALDLVGWIGDRRTIPDLERIFETQASGPLKRASFLGLSRMGAPYIGRKELACGWLPEAPEIDGHIDSTEWAAATPVSDFRGDLHADPEGHAMRALVGRDTTHLYLAFSCDAHLIPGRETGIRHSSDARVAGDRRLEVSFSQPDGGQPPVILAVTPLGALSGRPSALRERGRSWTAVSRRSPNRWDVEATVPFETLGIDRPSELQLLRFNVAFADGKAPADRWAWSVTYGGPEDPDRFGDLLVSRPPDKQKDLE
jgi:hypothetical protein